MKIKIQLKRLLGICVILICAMHIQAQSPWTKSANFECGVVGAKADGLDGMSEAFRLTTISNDRSFSGTQCAKMGIDSGITGFGVWGGIMSYPQNLYEGSEVWLRVRTFFPTGFNLTGNPRLKFLRVHTETVAGQNTGAGYLDLYILPQGGFSFDNEIINSTTVNTAPLGTPIQFNVWETYQVYVKFSSQPGVGIYRVWKNGTMFYENTTEKTLSTASSYSDRANIFTYWNGGAPQTQYMWIDDIVVSTTQPGTPSSPCFSTDTTAPSVPAGLTATAVSSSQVNLAWTASTDNVGVTGYRVERCQGAGCTTFTEVGTPTTNSYANTGLTANTSYTYRVRAVDAAGNLSGYSGTASATTTQATTCLTSSASFQAQSFASQTGTFQATFAATPLANLIDVVTGLSTNAATVHTDMACIVRFNTAGAIVARNGGVYQAASTIPYTANTTYSFRLVVNIPAHTYSIYVTPQGGSELTVGANYAFRTEQAAAGSLAYWNLAVVAGTGTHNVCNFTVTSTDITPPSVPTGLAATVVSSSQINLAWTASTDNVGVTGYRVERCQGAGCTTFTEVGTPTTNSYANTGLTANTSYTYRVRAVDAAGNLSGYSGTVTVSTDVTAPSVPAGLSATAVSSSQVNLAWTVSTDNVGVTGYRVERCQGAGCTTFTEVGTPTTNSYANTGLTANTSYTYRVRAVDAAGNLSGYSGTASATTQATCLTSSASYQAQLFVSQSGTFEAIFDATPLANLIDVVTGLSTNAATAHTDVACIVRFNTAGAIVARNGGVYQAASTIPYTANTTYSFRLVVNIPAHTYSIYVTPQGGSELTVGANYAFRTEQAAASSLAYWNLAVVAGTGTHTVCNFTLTNGAGLLASTKNAESKPTIEPNENEISLSVYPNPSSGQVNIKYILKEAGQVTLSLYGVSGQQLTTIENGYKGKGVHEKRYDALHLPNGIYFINLTHNGKPSSTKWLKQGKY